MIPNLGGKKEIREGQAQFFFRHSSLCLICLLYIPPDDRQFPRSDCMLVIK